MPIPASNGLLERFKPDLVHFATQQGLRTSIPSIYQPHDLLHRHYPELLSPLQVAYRDRAYRTFCSQASMVAVMTEWGRRDLSAAFGIPVSRIAVVPWAPVVGIGARPDDNVLDLPERFLLYPAQTWPHKNHLRLLAAIRLAADRGTTVSLVCTGRLNEHFVEIQRRALELGVERQVRFLGFVDQAAMPELYRRATALIYPSLFEGWGLPVVEAFAFGLPVVSANSTVLPEVSGGAALEFDPADVSAMCQAIQRVWTDPGVRASLRAAGIERARSLSWTRTASIFQALYRRILGKTLSSEEVRLLMPPTLVP
jgi:glycosyltransferase involved in cell wall biosynthesis